jgi:putative hydrolase of the HAD superfamily
MEGTSMEGTSQVSYGIDAVLFDFGGVLAEEGFRNGLQTIARLNKLDEESFVRIAYNAIHECGYVLGKSPESAYWEILRKTTGVQGDDQFLRKEILSRFILREWMFDIARKLRDAHICIGILSDQTDWLDELNARYDFFRCFDYVFNSYHMGKGKKDPTHFEDVVSMLGTEAHKVLFIDDDQGNCERASQKGLKLIRYIDRDKFIEEIGMYFPAIGGVL